MKYSKNTIMKQNIYKQTDKINTINRCFFDAEHGWLTRALKRLGDALKEFPNDPQIEYAEALIRKDFLGQGLKAQELFLEANTHATDRRKSNENYLFSTFNATKYARNEKEFMERVEIARSLAPDDSDLRFFNQILASLRDGNSYGALLGHAVGVHQSESQHGECASFAELALQSEEHSLDDELGLRKARMASLRELDKAAEASRNTRVEGFPPEERLTLQEAMVEMEIALTLDPEDHMLWNFKSGWLCLLDRHEEAIVAADRSLTLCPEGYVKPLTNKALALQKQGRKDESKEIAQKALSESEIIGDEGKGDKELAQRILESLAATQIPDEYMLGFMAERIFQSVQLTAQQEMAQWKGSKAGDQILKGLKHRVSILGEKWSNDYVKIMEEILCDFCPETGYVTIMRLADSRQEAYQHCLHAVLYIAAHQNGIMQQDACRFLIFLILGAGKYNLIRKIYREAILGSTAVGPGEFSNLEQNMRQEILNFNPIILKLVAEQATLNPNEIVWARNITMARFIDGISRDSSVARTNLPSSGRTSSACNEVCCRTPL